MEILLVEDQEHHLHEATLTLGKEQILFGGVYTQMDALKMLDDHQSGKGSKVDGVITDLFLPLSMEAPWNQPNMPCGLAVALAAESMGLPFVICTAGYHHGPDYEWIHHLARRRRWPLMVDGEYASRSQESPSKNWPKAIEVLRQQIAKKPASNT